MKKFLILSLTLTLNFFNIFGQNESELNCFTILVGKNASTDGSVFMAHNEDDLNDHNFVDLHKVPRIKHKADEKQIFLFNTDSIDEVKETFAYFWITGSKYVEEQYLNEWGVAITSNSSRSNVLNGNGRIDHNLRRIVIERSRTAREAVKMAGEIVEKYGYSSSGRIYLIADPSEAWVFEVANGKHWLARRVPDDEVAIIPNYYVIDDFIPSDTLNYLSSPGIIEYAENNGWYNSRTDGSFNFRKIYCHKDRYNAVWNIARKWVILNKFSEKQFMLTDDFPFSIKPKQKINIQQLIDALQNHYENTEFENHPFLINWSPHRSCSFGVEDTLNVCNIYNDYSCITQLRSWLSSEVGNIMWISPRYPCIQPFIPWYYGIKNISPNYEKAPYKDALANYNNKNKNYIEMYPDHACWVFDEFANKIDSSYGKEIQSLGIWKSDFQKDLFETIAEKEMAIINIYKSDREKALQMLTDLTNSFADRILIETREKLNKLNNTSR
ncbi:MAG: dipeptidase [Clostridiales bacterium]